MPNEPGVQSDFETWRRQTAELRKSTAMERAQVAARLRELDGILEALDAALRVHGRTSPPGEEARVESRAPVAPIPEAALPEDATLPDKITHVLRSVDRPLPAPEIFDLLKKIDAGIDADEMHSAIYRMKESKPPRLIVMGSRPNRTYALPDADASEGGN